MGADILEFGALTKERGERVAVRGVVEVSKDGDGGHAGRSALVVDLPNPGCLAAAFLV